MAGVANRAAMIVGAAVVVDVVILRRGDLHAGETGDDQQQQDCPEEARHGITTRA
jgi:hypothetical protein